MFYRRKKSLSAILGVLCRLYLSCVIYALWFISSQGLLDYLHFQSVLHHLYYIIYLRGSLLLLSNLCSVMLFYCSPLVFCGVRVTRFLVLCVCFVDRCLSFCPFFFWPLCCLSFFELWILIFPLVSLSSSYCCLVQVIVVKMFLFIFFRHFVFHHDCEVDKLFHSIL